MRGKILPTRQEILKKYDIPSENCFILPFVSGIQRAVRAFLIIEKRGNSLKYYGEGNTSHNEILNHIITSARRKGVVVDINDDDFDEKWVIRKGFIDPAAEGFADYPQVREGLIKQGFDRENIPNWFISASNT